MPIAAVGLRREQFDHPPRAGADIDQPSDRAVGQRAVDGPLDLALGDVERANHVPHLGMAGEIAGGRFGAVGAHRLQPGRIAGQHGLAVGIDHMVDHVHQRP